LSAAVTDALLAGLVDYAGLFPPASLDMDAALATYDAALRGGDEAMLGRFVVPVTRLAEMDEQRGDTWTAARPLRLSLLAGPADLRAVADPSVRVEAVEARLPRDVAAAVWLADLIAAAGDAGLSGAEIYAESPSADHDADLLAALGAAQAAGGVARLGAKLRCGGVTPDLVPPVARVAAVIAGARDHGVPLKFTAGLHHPVRGMDHTADTPMHGFLNVYGAALLAHHLGLTAAALDPVLAETDPAAFGLDAGAFAWRDLVVPAAAVADLRQRLLSGYGSCSFAEPVDDLRALSLLT
jgi:hypothetical protein